MESSNLSNQPRIRRLSEKVIQEKLEKIPDFYEDLEYEGFIATLKIYGFEPRRSGYGMENTEAIGLPENFWMGGLFTFFKTNRLVGTARIVGYLNNFTGQYFIYNPETKKFEQETKE